MHYYCVTPYWNESEALCKEVRWDKTNIEEVVFEALKAQIAVMTVQARGKAQTSTSKGEQLRQRLKALTSELETMDSKKVQSYIDYREGRITREDFISFRAEREKHIGEVKSELAETELAYQDYLKAQDQAQKERAIAEQTSSMDDEALKEIMYDAVDKVLVTDSQNIEIIWKFADLFATA